MFNGVIKQVGLTNLRVRPEFLEQPLGHFIGGSTLTQKKGRGKSSWREKQKSRQNQDLFCVRIVNQTVINTKKQYSINHMRREGRRRRRVERVADFANAANGGYMGCDRRIQMGRWMSAQGRCFLRM